MGFLFCACHLSSYLFNLRSCKEITVSTVFFNKWKKKEDGSGKEKEKNEGKERELTVVTYSASHPLRNRSIKKLSLHFLVLLSKAAKKLRLSQAKAKKLVKKPRLGFSPMRGKKCFE